MVSDADEHLARFLRDHGVRRGSVTAQALLAAEEQPGRVGTFLLRRQGAIIACLVVDERDEAGQRVAVFSAAVVRDAADRALLWRELVIPLLRVMCWGTYRRVELGEVYHG